VEDSHVDELTITEVVTIGQSKISVKPKDRDDELRVYTWNSQSGRVTSNRSNPPNLLACQNTVSFL
jgi:hypothetical protein